MHLPRVAARLLFVGLSLLSTTGFAAQVLGRSGDYEVQVLTPKTAARTFFHRGETWVLGTLGERYVIRVLNHSDRRVEVVASVDGRDVLDGKTASFQKRGYLIPPRGQMDIEGFRISHAEVAAFRFATVEKSYASKMGSARNVGVIGVAVFPERYVPPPPQHRKSEIANEKAPSAEAPSAPPPAPAPSAPGKRAEAKRPGLGTEFGEAVESRVESVDFQRAHPTQPAVVIGLRYNDREGLIAQGIDVDGVPPPDDAALRRSASPFPDSNFAAPPPGWNR